MFGTVFYSLLGSVSYKVFGIKFYIVFVSYNLFGNGVFCALAIIFRVCFVPCLTALFIVTVCLGRVW